MRTSLKELSLFSLEEAWEVAYKYPLGVDEAELSLKVQNESMRQSQS